MQKYIFVNDGYDIWLSPSPDSGAELYLASEVELYLASEIDKRMNELREILQRIASSHGASDHSCFRRDLADKALALLLGEKDL